MIGIIGGTGFEKSGILKNPHKVLVETEFGNPSPYIIRGTIDDKEVALISRHGEDHTITPTQVNNRANIVSLKLLGCTHIIATTACGSLRDDIKPGDFVIADQFIDFTKHRNNTFYDSFEPGKMMHCPMADPYSPYLREKILNVCENAGVSFHRKGTIITIEGPRFSTRAESHMFRNWGADLINMSTAPETALANEAGIPYAVIAISTDYDCWKIGEEPVSIEIVMRNFHNSVGKLSNVLIEVIKSI